MAGSSAKPDEATAFYAKNGKQWRKWLEKNHASAAYIWLIMYRKQSATPSVYYDEAVEEALCFGWIDSKPNKRDDESYYLFFAPRKPKSVWSALNKKRIIKLLEDKRMAPPGLAKIEAAKADGTWTTLDAIEALQMPEELKKAFMKNKAAAQNFDAFPNSAKKGIYQWIISAKRDETRMKRVEETVSLAEKNIRANQWKGGGG